VTEETTKFILEHSESKLVFIGKLDKHPWAEMKNGIPKGVATISFPLCPEDSGAEKTWNDIVKSSPDIKKPVTRTRDEMATIIYTSGSTGK
jgi:long-chain acyl-CoA synthetase